MWLFGRVVLLSREILAHLVLEYPFWFQAFGCVLGFDWHSRGVTTTVCGAAKESLKDTSREWGLFAAGGKGGRLQNEPTTDHAACEWLGRDPQRLVHASKTAAKVDTAAVQDGYQLYHHAFFFTATGEWCVVQQGMSDETSTARRYHWLSEHVMSSSKSRTRWFVLTRRVQRSTWLHKKVRALRSASTELAQLPPETALRAIERGATDRCENVRAMKRLASVSL